MNSPPPRPTPPTPPHAADGPGAAEAAERTGASLAAIAALSLAARAPLAARCHRPRHCSRSDRDRVCQCAARRVVDAAAEAVASRGATAGLATRTGTAAATGAPGSQVVAAGDRRLLRRRLPLWPPAPPKAALFTKLFALVDSDVSDALKRPPPSPAPAMPLGSAGAAEAVAAEADASRHTAEGQGPAAPLSRAPGATWPPLPPTARLFVNVDLRDREARPRH